MYRLTILMLTLFAFSLHAQNTPPDNWFTGDPNPAGPTGCGAEKAYNELLKGKESKTIIVAVLDSGIDIDHEDLKDVIWTNPGEIAGNGIDDDKNGYVDDVHGWNFMGGADGTNVYEDNLEMTRVCRDLYRKYGGANPKKLSGAKLAEYNKYKKLRTEIDGKIKAATDTLASIGRFEKSINVGLSNLKGEYSLKGDVKTADLEALVGKNPAQKGLLDSLIYVFKKANGTESGARGTLAGRKGRAQGDVNFNYNMNFDPRWKVGDNYVDATERFYGNGDVRGDLEDESHGSHVAGIIAANRKNTLGIKGVADNVKIMVVRCVPNGDERDKDVANAIRYAVDNGAQVLNMSFGKRYSYNKGTVDKAVKYALKKNVLLVHAAGNDAIFSDTIGVYPNPHFGDDRATRAKNFINVGAINWKGDETYAARFSNYGKNEVDLFAPGMAVNSTVPRSKYAPYNGTSMASPCVAGCAALLWSYYPELTAVQVKEILLSTVTKVNLQVNKPGTKDKVSFSDLSITGGVVNVYEAIKKAESMRKK